MDCRGTICGASPLHSPMPRDTLRGSLRKTRAQGATSCEPRPVGLLRPPQRVTHHMRGSRRNINPGPHRPAGFVRGGVSQRSQRRGTTVDCGGLTNKWRKQPSWIENRVEGTARNLGGKVQEGFGRVTGNVRTQAEGLANQAAGAAQDVYGQAADTARETASGFEKALRHTIETRPYTSALVALGIGWLLGRMHRPL